MLAPSEEHSSAAPAATAAAPNEEEERSQTLLLVQSDKEDVTQPVQEKEVEEESSSPDLGGVVGENPEKSEDGTEEVKSEAQPEVKCGPEPAPEQQIPTILEETPQINCESVTVAEVANVNDDHSQITEDFEIVEVGGKGSPTEAEKLEEFCLAEKKYEDEEKLISFGGDDATSTPATEEKVNHNQVDDLAPIAEEEDEVKPAETVSEKVIDCDNVVVVKPEVEITVTPSSGSGGGGEGDVVAILNGLESLKTPEPDEVENGTVRASFVQFELGQEEEGPLEEQSDSEEDELEEEEEVDEGVGGDLGESSTSSNNENNNNLEEGPPPPLVTELALPNPELQKIREEQVRQWLIFEQENPSPSGEMESGRSSPNNQGGESSIEVDSLIENGAATVPLQNGHSPPQTNGEATEDEEGELMVNGADGMPRRVRFLTDQEGNLLISVFMSNTPTAQLSEEGSSLLSNGGGEETPAGEGDIQNPSLVVSPPSLDTSLTAMVTNGSPSAPPLEMENGLDEASSFVLSMDEPMKEPPKEKPPDIPTQEEDEGCNSSDETLSVSSCNSMIEILQPGNKVAAAVAPLEPDVIIDENNNELKITPADSSIEMDKSMSSVTTCFQLNGEIGSHHNHHVNESIEEVTEEEMTSDASSSQPPSFIVHEPVAHNEGLAELNNPQLDNNNHLDTTPVITKLPIIDENNNVVEEPPPLRPQFHPDIPQMPELRQGTWSSSDDGDDERMTPPGEIPPPPRPNNAFIDGVLRSPSRPDDPDQQMVSLCIQEEHISAVALTIAKWESMSKAQSTENLSTTSASPTSGHAPVSKTSSSPCPCPTRPVHKPLMVTLSAKPVMHMPPVVSNIQVQQVIINASAVTSAPPTEKVTNASSEPTNNNSNNVQSESQVSAINVVNNGHSQQQQQPAGGEPIIVGKAPGWNCWGKKIKDVPNPNNKPDQNGSDGGGQTDEEIIYAQPNLQAGTTMTSITNPSAILKSYPKPLSKGEIIMWLKEGEIHRAGLMLNHGQSHHPHPAPVVPVTGTGGNNTLSPVLVNWFFGLISRQQAERYLHGQPSGTFLVRISTRIWGYTLSYQASSGRTKHFLISATNPAVPATLQAMTELAPTAPQTGKQQRMSPFLPQGRYAFIGTNMTPYGSLVSLIRHHSHAPITKLGGEKLISPCPGGPQVAGMEPLFKNAIKSTNNGKH